MKDATVNAAAEDYPYIRAYGRMLGSFGAYIDRQVDLAHAEGAPANATHRTGDGDWKTTDDIVAPDSRRALGLDPLPPIPVTVAAIAAEIVDKLCTSTWLRDRHGLAGTSLHDDGLRLTFTTGHTAHIRLEVLDPQPAN